jgi:ribosomal protein S18 acetylase RimI-like enzyme
MIQAVVNPLPVKIRVFQFPADYDKVYQLWEAVEKGIHVGRSDTPVEIARKIERDPDLFLIAESDGMIVGTVMGGFDGRRGLIYHLAVAASFRGHGIGSRLMDEVELRLRAKGCLKCYLLVTTDNEHAMHYYEKRGWEHMDDVRLYGKYVQ